MAVFVWSVTGPVFILETPLANAMKMISCQKKEERRDIEQSHWDLELKFYRFPLKNTRNQSS